MNANELRSKYIEFFKSKNHVEISGQSLIPENDPSVLFTMAGTQLQDSELYYDTDFRGGSAIVMGTESTGLTDIWRRAADAHIRIPMLGRLDSLNVSVSAAILLFEAVRQRSNA